MKFHFYKNGEKITTIAANDMEEAKHGYMVDRGYYACYPSYAGLSGWVRPDRIVGTK